MGITAEKLCERRRLFVIDSSPALVNMASAQPQVKTEPTGDAQNIVSALNKAFKGQNGAPLTGDQLAQWLYQNMAQLGGLVKEGKLTQGQILAVRKFHRLLPPHEFHSSRTLTRVPRVSPLCLCASGAIS